MNEPKFNEPKFKVGQVVYTKDGQRAEILRVVNYNDEAPDCGYDIKVLGWKAWEDCRPESALFSNREKYLEYLITELQSSFREYQDKMQPILTRLAKI
jgi:hypothetical protein